MRSRLSGKALAAVLATTALAGTVAVGAAGAAGTTTLTIYAANRSITYGDAEPAYGYTVYGLAAGDSLTTTPTCGVDGAHTTAGRYTITCSGADAGPKYTIKYVAGALAVAKATVTVKADNRVKLYKGNDPAFSYSTSGLLGSDTLVTEPTCGVDKAHDNAGTYQIVCRGADAGPNYSVKYTNGFLSVLRASLTIKASSRSIGYGEPEPTFGYSPQGLKSGDSLVTEPTCGVSGPHTEIGKYTVTCSGADAGPNYTVTYEDGTFSVNRAIVYVSAEPKTVGYGDADPAFTYTVTGLAPGDSLTSTPTCGVRDAHVAAGTYPITCSGAAADESHYLVLYKRADLTVTPATLTITAADVTRAYGSPDAAPGYSVAGFRFADKLKTAPTCSVPGAHAHVGTYATVCTGANAGPNYTITYVPGTLTVTKANSVATGTSVLLKNSVTATLTSEGGQPEAGATVVISSRGTTLCTLVTDSAGQAKCTLTSSQATDVTLNGYRITFDGNTDLYGTTKVVRII